MYSVLLKEMREILYHYKTWVCIALVAGLPFLFQKLGAPHDGWYYLLLFACTVGQFVYDSFLDDVREGGAIFVHNVAAAFFPVFCAKLAVSAALSLVLYLADLPVFLHTFVAADIPWLLCYPLYTCLLMFIACVLTDGSEMGSFFIMLMATFPLLLALNKLCSPVRALLLVASLTGGAFLLCKRLWNSKWYRCRL